MQRILFKACLSSVVIAFVVGFTPEGVAGNPVIAGVRSTLHEARKGAAAASLIPFQEKKVGTATVPGKHERVAPSAAKTATGLSLADILGVFFFLALVITHFCFCRKGVYPESLPLCEMSSRAVKKSIKLHSKSDR